MTAGINPCRHRGGHWIYIAFVRTWRCAACFSIQRRKEDRRAATTDTIRFVAGPIQLHPMFDTSAEQPFTVIDEKD